MTRNMLQIVVCSLLEACATQIPLPAQPVPPELVPTGFTAADCWIAKPAEVETASGPGGAPVTMGGKGPEVQCQKHSQGAVQEKSVPVCHTKAGKPLPLVDCCMTYSGDHIPQCTPKVQPPED